MAGAPTRPLVGAALLIAAAVVFAAFDLPRVAVALAAFLIALSFADVATVGRRMRIEHHRG